MTSFFQILIFSYTPFRLVQRPQITGSSFWEGLTPFRIIVIFQTDPEFRFDYGRRHTLSLCLMVLNSPVFRGHFHFKFFNVLTCSSEDSVFLHLYTKTLVVLQVCFMSMYTRWYKSL